MAAREFAVSVGVVYSPSHACLKLAWVVFNAHRTELSEDLEAGVWFLLPDFRW